MIPLGKIDFSTRPGSGPNAGHTVLIGRLELGQAMSFTKFEQNNHPVGKKNFLAHKRNEIRRAMWERYTREMREQVRDSWLMVRQHVGMVHPDEYRHIKSAFDLLSAKLEYDPATMDEQIFSKPPSP